MSKIIKYIISAAAALALSACSDEMPRGTEVNEEGFHVYPLNLDISFTDEEGSRSKHEWTNMEYVYIDFETGADTHTWGYAYYNTSYDRWELNMVTSLPEGVLSGNCTCWFFSNNYQHSISTSTEKINLNYDSAVYEAETTFSYIGDKLSITAKMNPAVGRFKLRSPRAITNLSFRGPSVPNHLDLTSGKVVLGNMVNEYFNLNNYDSESGLYTFGYVYAFYFADDTERLFKIKDFSPVPDKIYVRSYADNKEVLAPGTSGYIDVPTESEHEGWIMDDWRTYSSSYDYYGNSTDLSPAENTYYFNTVTAMQSLVGIQATITHYVYGMYDGTEASKKSAMLYIEVFDGEPTENSKPLDSTGIYLYRPDAGFEQLKEYETTLELTLPSSVKVNNTPYYRVSVLTDGIRMRLNSTKVSNWF